MTKEDGLTPTTLAIDRDKIEIKKKNKIQNAFSGQGGASSPTSYFSDDGLYEYAWRGLY